MLIHTYRGKNLKIPFKSGGVVGGGGGEKEVRVNYCYTDLGLHEDSYSLTKIPIFISHIPLSFC